MIYGEKVITCVVLCECGDHTTVAMMNVLHIILIVMINVYVLRLNVFS